MIRIQNLSKGYEGAQALKDLSLHVPRGAVYGLVGPNGAGKSTLLRCLSGVSQPDSGTVLIDGQPVWENAPLKARIAYIPDDLYYFTSANLMDMKKFYKDFFPTFDEQLFKKLGDIFPIDPKRSIRHLSKGMQKQAAFWLNLSLQPDLFLLDEPVDGLDPVMRRQLWSLIMTEVERRQVTVVISSHNLRELEDVCDHVGVIDHGTMLLERTLSQLQEDFVKVQLVFPPECAPVLPGITPLHHSCTGRVHTFILKCGAQAAEQAALAVSPVFYDILPLTLEEIFIYELGGADYAVKELVL
ncbi:MAG: ABC transporter ATP-binding protein [Clostridia bacterium]|nr:ABC transporter ATP-binding protein [Clostridia bacterium]